jgi:hypothetical protein
MDIYEKIIQCFQQSIDRPSIHKFFKYSLEDLQDNPDRLKEIADYLTKHEGKYSDFTIHTWIDEETFKPVFMLRLYLGEEYAKHAVPGMTAKFMQYFQNAKENQEKN